jgi:uncharacterized RDD family membrane protein YckC
LQTELAGATFCSGKEGRAMSYSQNSNSQNGPRPTWRSGERPDAYDPDLQPELFRGTLVRRAVAFVIDMVVLVVPVILVKMFIAVFGLITLGLGWMLFWLVWPCTVVWVLIYYGSTIGGPSSATLGMRAMDLELVTWYGEPGYFVLGAAHVVLFWVLASFLSPLVLLVGLFNRRRRLLHDILLGTLVINRAARATAYQPVRSA